MLSAWFCVSFVCQVDVLTLPLTCLSTPLLCAGQDGNKQLGLHIDRIKYWLSVGAQPSTTVGRLLGQAGIIPKPPAALHAGLVKKPEKGKSG